MAILTETLSVWEIGFRWAELDPQRLRLGLPLAVRDNFRLMMHAVLNAHLVCDTLRSNKWQTSDGEVLRPHFIRHHLDEVNECIEDKRYSRRLLRWAIVNRWEFHEWCERQGIPLPEFWFPSGWKLSYEWPSDELESDASTDPASGFPELRPGQRRRIACQEIAKALWKDAPETTIADMVRQADVRKLGGGMYQADEVVRRWLSAVAPVSVKEKRGRPRKVTAFDDV